MRTMISRFHTSTVWFRISITYCRPMFARMSAHAMWYCAWYAAQSKRVLSPIKYMRYMFMSRKTWSRTPFRPNMFM